MSRVTPRLRWSRALAAAAVPASLRPMKAGLLSLVPLMSPEGELHAWRKEMTTATGLPVRTLTRQLQRAVEGGWLVRDIPGGHGRRSLYRATIPGESCEPSVAHNCTSCGPSARTQLPEVVGHLAAHSIRQSTRVSKYGALDDQRGRRSDRDGARVSPPEHSGKSSSNGDESLPTPSKRPSLDTTAGEVA